MAEEHVNETTITLLDLEGICIRLAQCGVSVDHPLWQRLTALWQSHVNDVYPTFVIRYVESKESKAEDTARRRRQGAKDGWEIRRAKREVN